MLYDTEDPCSGQTDCQILPEALDPFEPPTSTHRPTLQKQQTGFTMVQYSDADSTKHKHSNEAVNLVPHDSFFTEIELQKIHNKEVNERIRRKELDDYFAIRPTSTFDNAYTTLQIIWWQEKQLEKQKSVVTMDSVAPLSLQWMLDIQMCSDE